MKSWKSRDFFQKNIKIAKLSHAEIESENSCDH